MGRARNWVQSHLPMLALVFCRSDVEVYEDRDYPGDPAPYLTVYWRKQHVASACGCGRQKPAPDFCLRLEREDSLALADAINKHWIMLDARAARKADLQRRIEARQL